MSLNYVSMGLHVIWFARIYMNCTGEVPKEVTWYTKCYMIHNNEGLAEECVHRSPARAK